MKYEFTAEEEKDFWNPIIRNSDGSLNEEQIMKELYDCHLMMHISSTVFCEITGNKVSKPNTLPGVILQFAEEEEAKRQSEALAEQKQEFTDQIKQKLEAENCGVRIGGKYRREVLDELLKEMEYMKLMLTERRFIRIGLNAHDSQSDCFDNGKRTQLAADQKAVDSIIEKIKPFLRHKFKCRSEYVGEKCTCGLGELLKELEG